MTPPVGNLYDKYGTRNPIARRLMHRFLGTVTQLAQSTEPSRVLEVGCGEGMLTQHLFERLQPKHFAACDLSLDRLASHCDPRIEFSKASIYDLPYADASFDLVVCCEVLEHLEHPDRALVELHRVSSRFALLSTPNEPLFRGLNVLRGAYLSRLGNTPGHIQHFDLKSLSTLVEARFRVTMSRRPIPWVVLLAEHLHF